MRHGLGVGATGASNPALQRIAGSHALAAAAERPVGQTRRVRPGYEESQDKACGSDSHY